MMWKADRQHTRYEREDGAVVRFDTGPPQMQWIAFEPDPSRAYIVTRNAKRGFGFPRRWKTARAAMLAVDTKFPIRSLTAPPAVEKE